MAQGGPESGGMRSVPRRRAPGMLTAVVLGVLFLTLFGVGTRGPGGEVWDPRDPATFDPEREQDLLSLLESQSKGLNRAMILTIVDRQYSLADKLATIGRVHPDPELRAQSKVLLQRVAEFTLAEAKTIQVKGSEGDGEAPKEGR